MKCNYIKPDGSKCSANALLNSSYCWYHSPDISDEQKKLVSSNGGRANSYEVYAELTPLSINKMQDVPAFLIDTMNNLRSGNMGIRLGTALGYLSGMLMKSFEVADLEVRIERMEKYMKENFSDK